MFDRQKINYHPWKIAFAFIQAQRDEDSFMRLSLCRSAAITQQTQLLHCLGKKKQSIVIDGYKLATRTPNALKPQQANIWSQIHFTSAWLKLNFLLFFSPRQAHAVWTLLVKIKNMPLNSQTLVMSHNGAISKWWISEGNIFCFSCFALNASSGDIRTLYFTHKRNTNAAYKM